MLLDNYHIRSFPSFTPLIGLARYHWYALVLSLASFRSERPTNRHLIMAPPTHIHSASAAVDGASLQTLWRSFAMIIVSEIGDKTFLIAAILAMRHPRRLVFSGAFASLVLMSLLSAELGQVLPPLIPRRWTQACAAVLFLVFGVKTFREGRAMKDGDDAMQEEMREAKEDIEGDEAVRDAEDVDALELGEKVVPLEAMERGCEYAEGCARRRPPTERSTSPGLPGGCAQKGLAAYTESTRKFFSYLLGPVFVQAFVLTFLGEWGDRSQISTIALAAADVSRTFLHVRQKAD